MRELNVFPLPPGTFRRSSGYGVRTNPVTGAQGTMHRGVDYAAPAETPVYAPFSGNATIGYQAGGAGHWVNVTNGSDQFRSFHHIRPARSGWVEAGEEIAHIGTTGSSTGAHGHFELWDRGINIDPTWFLDRAPLKGAQPAPAPQSPKEDDDMVAIARDSKTLAAYACHGLLKRYIDSQKEFDQLKYLGAKDLGVNDDFLNMHTEIPRDRLT